MHALINEQIALERDMAVRGIARYNRIIDAAEANGRGAETSYAQRLIPEYVSLLAEAIEAAKQKKHKAHGGQNAKFLGLIQQVDSEETAYITLRCVFDYLVAGGTVNNLAVKLGTRIEDQVRFSKFEAEHDAYYRTIIEDFKRTGTVNYRHMHRVLVKKSKDMGVQWNSWTPVERMHLGVKLLELLIESTGLIEKSNHRTATNKTEVRVEATAVALAWIAEHKEHAEILHPETMPCIIPPCDWLSLTDGGYYTPEIRARVPFVKIKSKAHRKAIKTADFTEAMQSVNRIQKTGWRVNRDVHAVIQDVWRMNLRIGMPASEPLTIPPAPVEKGLKKENMTEEQLTLFSIWKREASKTYELERERVSKCIQLSRVLQMAQKFQSYEEFFYVYNCDFRGRIYCASPGLSPQGADFSKGLLEFSAAKALGTTGAFWLCVHGANVYGYDKDTYAGRVHWVEEHREAILAVAANPTGSAERSFWADADKPYQFLAFCFEYRGYAEEGVSFESRLAVALDGSCNGLQNFSAMLRDSIGATATNLTVSDLPQDIYQRVSDVCIQKLTASSEALAAQWLDFGVTRKCSKRPVMTMPYGSTRQSCREYIEDYIIDNIERSPWKGREIFTASIYMSGIMWESIGEVVVAARAAMQWLQQASRVMSRENLPLQWTTPTGFLVYQGTMQYESREIVTQLCGRCRLSIATSTNEINGRKQALGASPNFVHSMDASHLIKTVAAAPSITAWAMIHDSYGTYAADTDELHRALRVAFVDMYTKHDVLREYADAVQATLDAQPVRIGKVELPELPDRGTFDITEVLSSLYFFG